MRTPEQVAEEEYVEAEKKKLNPSIACAVRSRDAEIAKELRKVLTEVFGDVTEAEPIRNSIKELETTP